jgi:GTP-binding protein HflX
VLNKVDLLDPEQRQVVLEQARRDVGTVLISARTGEGTDRLLAVIDERLGAARRTVEFLLPHGSGAAIAWLYDHGEVDERWDEDEVSHIRVRLDPADVTRFERLHGKALRAARS